MNDLPTALHTRDQADSTLRWGGRAGILGSLLMLLTFGFVAASWGWTSLLSSRSRGSPTSGRHAWWRTASTS